MNENLLWCIIGIVGGAIVSFFISFLFYIKGLTRKRLTYDIRTSSIISNKINLIKGLKIKYNFMEIQNLYSSTITIKNIGNSVIRESDLAPSCPISILTTGQFLNAKTEHIVLRPLNKEAKYNLSFQGNNNIYDYIEFNFDYIPKKAIITFSVFHTGNIFFNGDLIDGEIITSDENQNKNKNALYNIIRFIVCIIIGYLCGYFILDRIPSIF